MTWARTVVRQGVGGEKGNLAIVSELEQFFRVAHLKKVVVLCWVFVYEFV
jgi:hypothetical protein